MTNDLHDSVFDAIEAQINRLRSRTPASSPAAGGMTKEEVDTELSQLELDKTLLLDHWKTQAGAVGAPTPTRARPCGQAQPCPHVLGLAQKYGIV